MAFRISIILDKYETGNKLTAAGGVIQIDNFSEHIELPLEIWSIDDYIKQWSSAVNALLNQKSDKVALITELYGPDSNFAPMVWPIYKIEDGYVIQNQWLASEKNATDLSTPHFFDRLKNRETHDGDGNAISEWHVSHDDLVDFRNSLRPATNN